MHTLKLQENQELWQHGLHSSLGFALHGEKHLGCGNCCVAILGAKWDHVLSSFGRKPPRRKKNWQVLGRERSMQGSSRVNGKSTYTSLFSSVQPVLSICNRLMSGPWGRWRWCRASPCTEKPSPAQCLFCSLCGNSCNILFQLEAKAAAFICFPVVNDSKKQRPCRLLHSYSLSRTPG